MVYKGFTVHYSTSYLFFPNISSPTSKWKVKLIIFLKILQSWELELTQDVFKQTPSHAYTLRNNLIILLMFPCCLELSNFSLYSTVWNFHIWLLRFGLSQPRQSPRFLSNFRKISHVESYSSHQPNDMPKWFICHNPAFVLIELWICLKSHIA